METGFGFGPRQVLLLTSSEVELMETGHPLLESSARGLLLTSSEVELMETITCLDAQKRDPVNF